jgi:hypothetical protein
MTHQRTITHILTATLAAGGLTSALCFEGAQAYPALSYPAVDFGSALSFPIVDTGQSHCYDNQDRIACPAQGERFYGQDASYRGAGPIYGDNGDGTVTDGVTGLTWQQTPGPKLCWEDALAAAEDLQLGGHDDWRVPSITELYSLMDFDGVTGHSAQDARPFLDTDVFDFDYGDPRMGERHIDAQYWSSTEYVGTTMGGNHTVFGVNFADGRIKGYGTLDPRRRAPKLMFVRFVRGDRDYGHNELEDNGDGTVSDRATGLMWQQQDSGMIPGAPGDGAMTWEEALGWCESLDDAGHADWRLPDAKELQSIVDYSRAPAVTGTAAIAPIFDISAVDDGLGQPDFPYFWSSTTHLDGRHPGDTAVYVAFGEAQGWMAHPPHARNRQLMDVHGAGAQRSDPKAGHAADFPYGRGPQGDVISIDSFVRCVRDE